MICPPDTYSKVKGKLFQPPSSVPGCKVGTFGADEGKVVCSYPAREYVATPEPFGQRQPIKVMVGLARNENAPPNLLCESISAVVTTKTPTGAVGQPYLPVMAPVQDVFNIHTATLWLDNPGSNAESLLEPGSVIGVRVFGPCVSETHAEAVGVVPPPKPRISPGIP